MRKTAQLRWLNMTQTISVILNCLHFICVKIRDDNRRTHEKMANKLRRENISSHMNRVGVWVCVSICSQPVHTTETFATRQFTSLLVLLLFFWSSFIKMIYFWKLNSFLFCSALSQPLFFAMPLLFFVCFRKIKVFPFFVQKRKEFSFDDFFYFVCRLFRRCNQIIILPYSFRLLCDVLFSSCVPQKEKKMSLKRCFVHFSLKSYTQSYYIFFFALFVCLREFASLF